MCHLLLTGGMKLFYMSFTGGIQTKNSFFLNGLLSRISLFPHSFFFFLRNLSYPFVLSFNFQNLFLFHSEISDSVSFVRSNHSLMGSQSFQVSSSSSHSRRRKMVCYCGFESPVAIVWTSQNPGRRFHGCGLYKVIKKTLIFRS
jgi:hypothetical protein